MKTIVFQGDSITDSERRRDHEMYMGSGYVTMTAGKVAMDHPGKYRFYNRGISGDRSVDLYARIKVDLLNLKPDILTVLIGVNDVWHEFGLQNGVSPETYEMLLDLTVKEVLADNPEVKIFLLEPFVLPGSMNEGFYDDLRSGVLRNASICKSVAHRYGVTFVPLQKQMDELAAATSDAYVLFDGVHPNLAGHELISRALYAAMADIL